MVLPPPGPPAGLNNGGMSSQHSKHSVSYLHFYSYHSPKAQLHWQKFVTKVPATATLAVLVLATLGSAMPIETI